MKSYLLLLSLCLTASLLSAQKAERRSGELLLQLHADAGIQTVLTQLSRAAGTPVTIKSLPAAEWRVYLLRFDETQAKLPALLSTARALPGVNAAQWNHKTSERKTPNDDFWGQQDNMTLIGMPAAWDVTTGGVTPAGDTIVVAVLEKGTLLSHPDLAPNIYYNRAETPGNGVDDDGNGYVDDYRGWNPRTGDDDPGVPSFHGTGVAGIIGARGNNNEGVAGINWNVKLLCLANVEYEDEIIAAYNYVAKMRRLYNTSNGQKGAFITVTNASFGFDKEWAADHQLWCAAYDSLGAVGVISVGATANADVDVDEEGDMPTTCESEYLITVTNVDKFDNKRSSAGYGNTYIDLGAPGHNTYTTLSDSQTPKYGYFDGTSAATPHVTGAVALLYSLNCASFTADALSQPELCARRVRATILENVAPNETLAGITVTGGRLDVQAAVNAVQTLCDGAVTGPLQILQIKPNPVFDFLTVNFQTPTYNKYIFRVFNMLGQLIAEDSFTPDPFVKNEWKFDASLLPLGVYVVSLSRNDAVRSEKFVKN